MVACQSGTLTRSSTAANPSSSVAPKVVPAFDAPAGQPGTKRVLVVIASGFLFVLVGRQLGDGQAAKLTTPNHQRSSSSPRCLRSSSKPAIGKSVRSQAAFISVARPVWLSQIWALI